MNNQNSHKQEAKLKLYTTYIEWNQCDGVQMKIWSHKHNVCFVWRMKILWEKYAIKMFGEFLFIFFDNNCFIIENNGIMWLKPLDLAVSVV